MSSHGNCQCCWPSWPAQCPSEVASFLWSSHLSAWSCRLATALEAVPAGNPRVRFFAGIPLLGPGGLVLGSLCLVGREPQQPTNAQCSAFTELAGEQVLWRAFKYRAGYC